MDKTYELLYGENNLKSFTNYFNRRCKLLSTTPTQISSLLDKHVYPVIDIGYPKLVKINKINSSKKRDVYLYSHDVQLVLKYINFVINSLDLGIHTSCYSFQKGIKISKVFQNVRDHNFKGCHIKADISNYFNSIPTNNLKGWLPKSITDNLHLLQVIEMVINNPIVRIGETLEEIHSKGVMAGIPFAPTLSNLYLKSFDHNMSNRSNFYARYSDDFLLSCDKGSQETILVYISNELHKLGLKINPEKTFVYTEGQPIDFLGFSIRDTQIDLSKITISKMKGKIKRIARSLYRWKVKKNVPVDKVVMVMNRKLNRKLYGYDSKSTAFNWSRYFFSVINTDKGLKEIDKYYQETARYLATGRYIKSNYRAVSYKMLKEKGYRPLVSEYYKSNTR